MSLVISNIVREYNRADRRSQDFNSTLNFAFRKVRILYGVSKSTLRVFLILLDKLAYFPTTCMTREQISKMISGITHEKGICERTVSRAVNLLAKLDFIRIKRVRSKKGEIVWDNNFYRLAGWFKYSYYAKWFYVEFKKLFKYDITPYFKNVSDNINKKNIYNNINHKKEEKNHAPRGSASFSSLGEVVCSIMNAPDKVSTRILPKHMREESVYHTQKVFNQPPNPPCALPAPVLPENPSGLDIITFICCKVRMNQHYLKLLLMYPHQVLRHVVQNFPHTRDFNTLEQFLKNQTYRLGLRHDDPAVLHDRLQNLNITLETFLSSHPIAQYQQNFPKR